MRESPDKADEKLHKWLCFLAVTHSEPGQRCLHWPDALDSQL